MTRTTDIVVVGAGIAGAAVAAELSRRARVVLVEREAQPAFHASGRSASVLSETSGHPTVCALARLSRPWFEARHDGLEHSLLSPRGLVWIGESGDEPLLDALAATGSAIRPSVVRLDRAEAARLLPHFSADAIAAGAVHEPDAMSIDTAAAIATFLRSFRRDHGEVLLAHEAVTVTTASAGGWVVHAGDEVIECGAVVNAAGAWADELAVRAGLRPIGLRALRRTAALAVAPTAVQDWPLVMDAAGRFYCEPEPGGLLISPADETPVEPCDAQPEEIDVALAIERVAAATGLPLRSIRRAWAGLRCFAEDRRPVLGEDPDAPGFWWLAGQGGAGIKTAPAMAALLAGLLVGDLDASTHAGVDVGALSPARFRT